MIVSKLASAIYNDIVSGLSGYNATLNMSLEQLEDEVVEERMAVIKQYSMKNLIPKKDLFYAINCIQLDCDYLDKCCITGHHTKPISHFEIPQIMNDFGEEAIEYIGTIDKNQSFRIYTTPAGFKYHNRRMRGKDKPYVYIDTTPNEHNMYDCYVFNAPMLETLTIIAIFKDPRQVVEYMTKHGCCNLTETDNMTWLATEVKQNVIKKKLSYYRQLYQPPVPNTQIPK